MQQHQLTVAQAAKLYGKARSTIHRAMKAGRLSSTFRGDGTRVIAFSELLRVWGEPLEKPSEAQHYATPSDEHAQQAATPEVFAAMLAELQALRSEVAELRQHMMRLPGPLNASQSQKYAEIGPGKGSGEHAFTEEMAALRRRSEKDANPRNR